MWIPGIDIYPMNYVYSGYSAHEHSILYGSVHSVPLDVTLETLVAIIFVTLGLVLGSERLRPISWSVWAGEIEKEGGVRNPFRGFEDRIGFWDVKVRSRISISVRSFVYCLSAFSMKMLCWRFVVYRENERSFRSGYGKRLLLAQRHDFCWNL